MELNYWYICSYFFKMWFQMYERILTKFMCISHTCIFLFDKWCLWFFKMYIRTKGFCRSDTNVKLIICLCCEFMYILGKILQFYFGPIFISSYIYFDGIMVRASFPLALMKKCKAFCLFFIIISSAFLNLQLKSHSFIPIPIQCFFQHFQTHLWS